MKTHEIPDKVRDKVNKMFSGADKNRTIQALESGKTVYIGGHKFRGIKVEKPETVSPPVPAAAKSESKTDKDKDRV